VQNSIFRGNEKLDAFKLQMNWNQEEMEQWAVAAKQKEEDNLALLKYTRQDDVRLRDMALNIEKLSREVQAQRVNLENEVTATQAAQVELDKTSDDFQQLHKDRQELMNQWEASLEAKKRRDESIEVVSKRLAEQIAVVEEVEALKSEKASFLKELEVENEGVDREVGDGERVVQRVRAQLASENSALTELTDETELLRSSLRRLASDLSQRKTQVGNARSGLELRKERLETARRRLMEVKKRLEGEFIVTADLEKAQQQVDNMLKQEKVTLKAREKELDEVKKVMFKKSQELFDLRKEEANKITEISGNQTADRNLRDKINQLDEQSTRQQELIYNSDFKLQLMERKVSRAQGERSVEEKVELNKKIEDLEQKLKDSGETLRMLHTQLKRVNDDVRGANRKQEALKSERSELSGRIHELSLENEALTRQLRTTIRSKEEATVNRDLLALNMRKLKEALTTKADDVAGLESKKQQLGKSMEERMEEIEVQKELLRAEKKMASEDEHRVVMLMRERELHLATLNKKFELLEGKLNAQLGEGGERKSPAYYVVVRAQEREELQRKGDAMDAKIAKMEREIRALEGTLAKLTNNNARFRASFAKMDPGSKEAAAKKELEARMERLLERRKQRQHSAEALSSDVADMKARLSNLRHEADGQRRQMELLQQRIDEGEQTASVAARDASSAQAKLSELASKVRAETGVGPDGVSIVEKECQAAELQDGNRALLATLIEIGNQAPELGIAEQLEQDGIMLQGED